MRPYREWLEIAREAWSAHPDDYDPTDEELGNLVRDVQVDARKCDGDGHHGLRAVILGHGAWCCTCGTMFVMRS